jgi:tRNA(Ile)-lysidine synthase
MDSCLQLPPSPSIAPKSNRICVAVSGGADSVALVVALHAANLASRESLGVGLSAVHVHHGLRGADADADLNFVQDLCIAFDIPLHLRRASVPERIAEARAAGDPETIEEAARNLRYDFFNSLINSGHVDSVLTAHTRDDQAETVLMKFLRGAWTEGLSGIYPVLTVPTSSVPGIKFGKILRPLLQTSRAEVESYLTELNQSWREDASNSDLTFTRNRVRHEILPILRQLNPSLDQTLGNLAELAREEESRWQAELSRVLPQLLLPGKPVRGGGRSVSTSPTESKAVSLEIERLRTLDPALRRRVLRAAARQLDVRISFDETSRLLALCGFLSIPTVSSKPGTTLQLSNHLRAERSPRELHLSRIPQINSLPL